MPKTIPDLVNRLRYRFPSFLLDRFVESDAPSSLAAVKLLTVNEDFFQGHFPGVPLMPGVLMIEALTQTATALLMRSGEFPATARVTLRGVEDAKFRRHVIPGDAVRLNVARGTGRGPIERVRGTALVGDQVVAEATLVFAVARETAMVHPTAIVGSGAQIGVGTTVGPHAVIGPRVRIGDHCRIGASAAIDGWTEIGDGNEISPFVSIGFAPQDLKYRGEETRVVIGDHNTFREFVTVSRGTAGGGGVTRIGSHNLFMAYSHVAHDCQVGNETIFGNAATLGGHVHVGDYATISAFSGVHQFCRVGAHAFIGAYSKVTRDALPYAKSVGNPARIYGLNRIGLVRRGFSPDLLGRLKHAYHYLLFLNRSRALGRIEEDSSLDCPEVRGLVDFIRTSERGVLLRRPHSGKTEESGED